MTKRPPKFLTTPLPADERRVVPISNLPKRDSFHIPSERDLEIYRLNRQLSHQKGEIKRKLEAIRFKNLHLTKWLHMAELGLDYGEWPTLGEFQRLFKETKAAIQHEGKPYFGDDDEMTSRERPRNKRRLK